MLWRRSAGCRNSFHHYSPPKRKEKKKMLVRNPVLSDRLPPPVGGRITINNEKSESQEAWNVLGPLFFRQAEPPPVHHSEFCMPTVIWISVISEG